MRQAAVSSLKRMSTSWMNPCSSPLTRDSLNRVHLCHGHFKNYTEGNPLFGKYTGRYWWQPFVRGNKKKGVVMKDYLVKSG
jgi:hypothetical protein